MGLIDVHTGLIDVHTGLIDVHTGLIDVHTGLIKVHTGLSSLFLPKMKAFNCSLSCELHSISLESLL